MFHDLQAGELTISYRRSSTTFFEPNLVPNQLHQLVNFNIEFNLFIRRYVKHNLIIYVILKNYTSEHLTGVTR